MAVEIVEACSVGVGDKIAFPNSRHLKEVEATICDEEVCTLTTDNGTTKWHVKPTFKVQREEKS